MFTVPLYADRWVGGQGMGTGIALVFTIVIWLACLITTLAAIGIHAGMAPLNVAPSIREQARAAWALKFLRAPLGIGVAAIFVGLSGLIWVVLPVSASGTLITHSEAEPRFLAANLLVVGFIVSIAANWMAKTETRISSSPTHEKTRPA